MSDEDDDSRAALDQWHLEEAEAEAYREYVADSNGHSHPVEWPCTDSRCPDFLSDPPPPDLAARMIRAVRVQQVASILDREGCQAPFDVANLLADLGLLAVPSKP